MQYLTRIKMFVTGLTNPHPVRDWYLALSVAAVFTLTLVGLSVYFFIGIQAGFIMGGQSSSESALPSVSREGMLRTLETYETRTVNFEANNYPVPTTTDPSR